MKTCFKCKETKPRSEFYRHKQMGDGLLGKCKECTKADTKAVRAARPDHYLAYDRSRAMLPHRVAARQVYAATEAGKRAGLKARKKFVENNPHKRAAQIAVGNAVRDGRLLKAPCMICGADHRIHGHHDNYAKPLDVVWLCAAHHSERHKTL